MSTTNKRISDLHDIDLHSKIYILASDLKTSGAYRSGRVSFHDLSSNIYKYSYFKATEYAKEQDDILKAEIKETTDALLDDINVLDRQITNINAVKIPYVSGQVDALSNGISADLLNLSNGISNVVLALSTNLSNEIQNLSTALSNEITSLWFDSALSFDSVSTYVKGICANISADVYQVSSNAESISSIVKNQISVYATADNAGFIKTGYVEDAENKNYPIRMSDGNAYVHVPWTGGGGGGEPAGYGDVTAFVEAGKRTVGSEFQYFTTLQSRVTTLEPLVEKLDDQINNGEQKTFEVQNYDLVSYDNVGSTVHYIGKNDTLVVTSIINAVRIDTSKTPPTYSIDGTTNIEAKEYDVIKLEGQDTYQVCQMIESSLRFVEKSCVVAIDIADDKKSYDAKDIENSILNQLTIVSQNCYAISSNVKDLTKQLYGDETTTDPNSTDIYYLSNEIQKLDPTSIEQKIQDLSDSLSGTVGLCVQTLITKQNTICSDISTEVDVKFNSVKSRLDSVIVTADVTCDFTVPAGTSETPSVTEVVLDVQKENYYPVRVIVGKLPENVQDDVKVDHHTYIYDTLAYLTLKNTSDTKYSSTLTANVLYVKS